MKHRRYSRQQVAKIFEPHYDFKPSVGSWGLSGIVRLKPGQNYVFFVTLDKTEVEGYNYQDSISKDGIVTWETQNRHDQQSKIVKHLIEIDHSIYDLHLFVREGKKDEFGSPLKMGLRKFL